MVLALVWKSPLERMHLFPYSCHSFLFKFWHVKIKLSQKKALLCKYKAVHFNAGIKTLQGWFALGFGSCWRLPSSSWQSCSPAGQGQILLPSSMPLSWHTPDGEHRALRVSPSPPGVTARLGLPQLAQGATWMICDFHAAWHHCIIKKEAVEK